MDQFGPNFFGSLFGGDFSIVLTGEKSETSAPRMWFRLKPRADQEVYVHNLGGLFTTAQENPQAYHSINPAQLIITDIIQKYSEFDQYLQGKISRLPPVPKDYSPQTLVELLESGDPKIATPRAFQTQRLAESALEPKFSSSEALQRLRAFYRSRGAAFSTSMIGFFDIIRLIFLSSILIVSDSRSLSQKSFLEDLESAEFPFLDLSYDTLPGVLHRLKNGELISGRKRLTDISKLFSDLSGGLTFDVVIKTSSQKINQGSEFVLIPKSLGGLFSPGSTEENFLAIRPLIQDRKIHELSIEIRGDSLAYPLELSAAGIAEALLLSTSIGSTTKSVIFLDEPGQKMHPNLQGKFLDALESFNDNDNQFFIITHSPYLIRGDKINYIWRFDLEQGVSRVKNVGENVQKLKADDKAKVELSLRNADIRALLFSRGVVLVEGPSDKIVLEKLDEYLARSGDSADLSSKEWSVVEVGGKSSFPTFFKLCNILGIPKAAVADYDALMQLDKRTSDAGGKLQTSPLLLALYLNGELTEEEIQLINKNAQNIYKEVENDTKWYDPSCFPDLRNIAKSHRIFVLTEDLEGALQTNLTKKDKKPLKAFDEILDRIQNGKLSDELKDLGSFLKDKVS
ncbi:MAG: TOPRIM nucleotidyl transferase/hydrolase domain-containing protein [Candidatus Micrarchaeaceae archaeon]